MFKLRADHLASFEAYMQQSFEQRTKKHLRDHHADAVSGVEDEELISLIRERALHARQHQFQYEQEILAWIELTFYFPIVVADGRPQWISDVMRYPSRPGLRKVEILQTLLNSEEDKV